MAIKRLLFFIFFYMLCTNFNLNASQSFTFDETSSDEKSPTVLRETRTGGIRTSPSLDSLVIKTPLRNRKYSEPTTTKPTILIIEDTKLYWPIMRRFIELTILDLQKEPSEFAIVFKENGKDGIKAHGFMNPIVTFLDSNLSDSQGKEVLVKIKKKCSKSVLNQQPGYFIAISTDEEHNKNMGADAIIPKPFIRKVFCETLKKALLTYLNNE